MAARTVGAADSRSHFCSRRNESWTAFSWWIAHMFAFVPAKAVVANFLQTFKEFPPRRKPASFTVDQVLESMMNAAGSARQ